MGRDIHKFKEKTNAELDKIMKSDEICDENKDIIKEFHRHCIMKDLSYARKWKYLYHLRAYAESFDKSFRDYTKDDVMEFIEHLESQDYSSWTKHDNRVIMKSFFKWLNGGEYPEIVKWVNTNIRGRARKLPEEILTEEDIKKMVDAARTPRNKAIAYVLYESGCRIGEFLTLKIKHVRFDEYGALLTVSGKTGMRRVRIIASVSYLADWLEYHPVKDDPEHALWICFDHKVKHNPLSYQSTYYLLQKLADKAGIKKKVNPHAFRHARATFLANELTDAQLNEHFGWKQNSDMSSVYVHLSGRDVDKALLKIHGIEKKEKKEKQKFHTCKRCREKNSPHKKFCGRCGAPLSLKTVLSKEDEYVQSDELTYEVFREMMKINPEFEQQVYQAMVNLDGGQHFKG